MNRAAQQLGRLAKGMPKTLSPAFLAANREKLGKINAVRKRKKRRRQNADLSDGDADCKQQENPMANEPTAQRPTPALAGIGSKELLAALDELEKRSQADHPDETVQWAINELSDEGHAYLFGPRHKVLDAYKAWKAANQTVIDMPSPHHHIYYAEFGEAMRQAGLSEQMEDLKNLEKREFELAEQLWDLKKNRKQKSEALLRAHYDTLRPHLRPCHQRRGDDGSLDIELSR
jgi:hypothetical protein